MPDSIGPVWSDPISTSGTFTRVPALVPRSSPSGVLNFDDAGVAAGVMSQFEADVAAWIGQQLDPLMWNPGQIQRPVSGRCSFRTPTTWPDGSPAVLFCTRDPKHAGAHEAQSSAGNVMPLPVDDLEEQVI
jgi:hypothetical protein